MSDLTSDEVGALLAAVTLKNGGEIRLSRDDLDAIVEAPKNLVMFVDQETEDFVVTLEDVVDGQ